MTTTLIQPGLRAVRLHFPTTVPIGHTSRGPIFLAAGGRGGGVEMIVDDRDDDSDPFEDDDGDEDDDRDDDGSDDEDEDDEPRGRRQPRDRRSRGQRGRPDDTEEWTPPTRERWESTLERLHRANGEAARRRHLAKVLDKIGASDADALRERLLDWGVDPDSGQRITGDSGQGDEPAGPEAEQPDEQADGNKPTTRTREQVIAERRQHETRGAEREASRYKPAVALFAAESALREAGWNGQNMARALKLIDPEMVDIEFDEASGWPVVTGLDEQIEGLRDEFPEWFRSSEPAGRQGGRQGSRRRDDDDEDVDTFEPRPRPRRRTGVREIDGGDRGRPAAQPKSWVQMLNDRIVRGR